MFNFKSLQDVATRFKTEEDCKAYLEQARWNGKPVCPHCGSGKVYRTNAKMQPYKCGDKTCNKKFSVTVGLVMEHSKIPLSKWFIAIYLGSAHKKGISSIQLAKDLGITQKSAWHMMHRIREAMRVKAPVKANNIVEVDETLVGGKMKHKHVKVRAKAHADNVSHAANKTGVMGILERNNMLRLEVIDKSQRTLKQMVRDYVEPTATVFTDSFIAYQGLSKEFAVHEIVNHTEDEYVRNGYIHTNSIEGAFSQLKRAIIGIFHQVSVKHLSRYCDETAYKYNSRKMKDGDRFELSVRNTQGKLRWNDLVKK